MALVRMSVAQAKAQFPDLFAGMGPKQAENGQKRVLRVSIPPVRSIGDLLVPYRTGNLQLQPEQVLSIELFRALCAEHRAGRLLAVCTCICNELPLPVYDDKSRQIAVSIQTKRRAMGMIPGASDWVFVWKGGGLFAELKAPGAKITDLKKVKRVGYEKLHPVKRPPGRTSKNQNLFAEWCERLGVPYRVWFEVGTALAELRLLGALRS